MPPIRTLLILACLVGCDDGSRPPPEAIENEGTACLFGYEPAGSLRHTFPADKPIEIAFRYEGVCLSSECTIELSASCEATVSGSTVSIATHASWRDMTGTEGFTICSDDCVQPYAMCTTPPLPAGDYAFTLATRSLALAVPSMVEMAPCIP